MTKQYTEAHLISFGEYLLSDTRNANIKQDEKTRYKRDKKNHNEKVVSDADIANALAWASSVQTMDHLCLPSAEAWPFERRPASRLFRHIDKPMDSFSKWWIQVNRNVRHLQQLVYPLPQRPSTP